MKLKCLHCENKFDGNISYDELGWHSVCPECGCSFDVDVPDGKIIMTFIGRNIENIDFTKFEDNHTKNEIYSYRAYNSVKSFMNRWRKMAEKPDSMWYWVIDGISGEYITAGACSIDGDKEIFKDYFGKLS